MPLAFPEYMVNSLFLEVAFWGLTMFLACFIFAGVGDSGNQSVFFLLLATKNPLTE